MNKTSTVLLRLLSPDPLLFWAYVLPILYWIYLTLTTNFVLVFDSESYYSLAQVFYQGHWVEYFKTGPNREPLYPLIVAASMLVGQWLSVSYTYVLKVFSFGLLAMTMIFIQKTLETVKAGRWVQVAAVLYTGFSPILINSALCLYSEIATFPWLPGTVFFSVLFLRTGPQTNCRRWSAALGVGFCLLCFTMVKGIGELLSPLFMFWLGWRALRKSGLKILPFIRKSGIILTLLVFYVPLLTVKSLNYVYNGHFALTNRAEVALFGDVVQRADTPLTLHNCLVHLSTVTLSYPLCSRFFSNEECSYWFKSSDIALQDFLKGLDQKGLSESQKLKEVHRVMLQKYLGHPLKQWVHTMEEGLKMFFWETTQGPFVIYPSWLVDLFQGPKILAVMTLGAGFFCMACFAVGLFLLDNELLLTVVVLTSILMAISGVFNVIGRYAIMAGPLMILLNASCFAVLIQKSARPSSH